MRLARLLRRRPTPVVAPPQTWDQSWLNDDQPAPAYPGLISQACTEAQVRAPLYGVWTNRLGQKRLTHRKQWEWTYILQALDEHALIAPGKRGLGFGVGTEPITPYLASQGVIVTATDLPADQPDVAHWSQSGQHATTIAEMNAEGLCPADQFTANVEFRPVDMRALPADLRDYDFTWSSCAFEHLGTLEAGMRFVTGQMACLKPGGVGVHTTEFNVSSKVDTVRQGTNVAYRRRDLEELIGRLRAQGHHLEATFFTGDGPLDRHVDVPPFTDDHLKTILDQFVITSFGLIITKAG